MGSVDNIVTTISNNDAKELAKLLPSPCINDLLSGDGFTPLSYAIYCGREKIVKLLLDQQNIDVNKKNGGKNEHPFYIGGIEEKATFKKKPGGIAHKTPIEVAKYVNRPRMIELLDQHNQKIQQERLLQGHRDRKAEASLREELNLHEEGQIFKEIVAKVTTKNETEIIEMMNRGEVPTNMWTIMLEKWEKLKFSTPELQNDHKDTTRRITTYTKLYMAYYKRVEELQQKLFGIEQQMQTVNFTQQALDIVRALSDAEKKRNEEISEQLFEEQEKTVMSLDDIGYFLNSIGMARNSRKLFSLYEKDLEMTEMSLANAGRLLMENVPLGDRLDILFGISMVKRRRYPPYQNHFDSCPVCKTSVADLLQEYDIQFKEEVLAKEHFSSYGLPFLKSMIMFDFSPLLETNTYAEKLKSLKAIKTMYDNHTNHV